MGICKNVETREDMYEPVIPKEGDELYRGQKPKLFMQKNGETHILAR